jgi:hypothetical protein
MEFFLLRNGALRCSWRSLFEKSSIRAAQPQPKFLTTDYADYTDYLTHLSFLGPTAGRQAAER